MITLFQTLLAALFGLQTTQPAVDPDPQPAAAPVQGVRVVELFTSQACGMCPGANELLEAMGEGDETILALAYGVNYWDGFYDWRDPFAQESFVARQEAYVAAGEARRVYTPHFVVNGSPEKLRYSHESVRDAVEQAPVLGSAVRLIGGEAGLLLELAETELTQTAQIWAVAYQDGVEIIHVEGGPNQGRDMHHYNMVRSLELIAEWDGQAMSIMLDPPGEGLASAVLIQDGPGGPILAAARVE